MYVQLYTKSVYTLLKSNVKLLDYILFAKEQQMKSLALTDEMSVYALIKFYKLCKKHDIEPILGITIYLENNIPLILYAKNNEGYKNLLKIATALQLNEKRQMSFDELKTLSSGLIAILPSQYRVETLLINHQYDILHPLILNLKRLFSHSYLSVFPPYLEQTSKVNEEILTLSKKYDMKVVALNEVKYLHKEDQMILKYIEAIGTGEKIHSQSIELFNGHHHFLDTDSFEKMFSFYKQAIIETLDIAKMCKVTIDFDTFHLPKYTTPIGVTSDDYLKMLCKKGLEKRLNTDIIPDVYLNRLIYELNVISNMNYSDYFLIVYDFVKYAKKNNISVGPGRGSAAGSLVSYVLGITNVDPIEYNLLFERFLNPERISMPDIDLDFQDDRRDEVISYVQQKYGKHHVAHIVTFGTFASRSAIREIAKVMNFKESRINEINNYVDSSLTIEDNIQRNSELKNMIEEYSEIKKLFKLAKEIESNPRNTSTHAAGIIICEEDLRELTGLQNSLDDIYQTQYEAKDLEDLGLLKMDFLGLRNLTSIDHILNLIKHTEHLDLDMSKIPLDDAKTYRLISRGETTGIFQLESNGMRNVLMDIKASTFEDIVAVNALFRPGPMDNIPLYIKRKNHEEKVEYLHPDLIPILQSTYGIIVYQEQIMMIAQKIANYSLARADLLRRLVSKKQKDQLEKERMYFIQSAKNNGYEEETSIILFDYIVKFGDYGFNRSHSVAYALISYQMAYLKANYLTPFMVVLLTSVLGSESQTSRYIMDCKRYGLKILPLSINKSYNNYVIENHNNIRMPFLSVKGIGNHVSDMILKEREKSPFKSYFDFVFRTHHLIKRNVFDALVFSSALDEFQLNKKTMLENYEKVYDLVRFNPSGYFTDKIEIDVKEEYTDIELMKKEKEILGFYLTSHPIRKYIDRVKVNYVLPSQTLKYMDQYIELIGFIEHIRKTMTKKNEEMATLTVSDDITTVQGVIFPKQYQNLKDKIVLDAIVIIRCKVQEKNQKIQLIVNEINLLK